MAGIGSSPLPPPVGGVAGPDDNVGPSGGREDEGLGGQLESELAADQAAALKLLTAAADGELEVVKHCILAGTDPDSAPDSEETALMVAAREGHLPIVEFLLTSTNASVDLSFESGWTALHYAVWHGFATIAQALVQTGGADPNKLNRDGISSLVMAQTDATKVAVAKAIVEGMKIRETNEAAAAKKAAIAAAAKADDAPTKKATAAASATAAAAATSDSKYPPSATTTVAGSAAATAAGATTVVGAAGNTTASASNASQLDSKHSARAGSASGASAAAAGAGGAGSRSASRAGVAGGAVSPQPPVMHDPSARVPSPNSSSAAAGSTAAAAAAAAAVAAGMNITDQFAAIDEVLSQFSKLYVYSCETLHQPPVKAYKPLVDAVEQMMKKTIPLSVLKLNGDSPLWDRARPRMTLPQLVPLLDILGGQFAHAPFTTIDLSHNNLPGAIAPALCAFLKHTQTLTHLNLEGNELDSDAGIMLAHTLWTQDTLLGLSMKGNPLGDKANCQFAKMLKHNKTLTSLHMGHTDAGTVSLVRYAVAMSKNQTLTDLNLDAPLVISTTQGSGSDESTTIHFAKMLSAASNTNGSGCALRSLSLAQHRMRDFGADWIATHLMKNKKLTHLDLSKNEITFSGVAVLLKALSARPLSTSILLNQNSLTAGAGCTLRLRPQDEVDELLLAPTNRPPLPPPPAKPTAGGIKFTVTGADQKESAVPLYGGGGNGLAMSESKTSLASSNAAAAQAALKSGCRVTFESKLDQHRLVATARNGAFDDPAVIIPSQSQVFGKVAPKSSSE